MHSFPQYSSAMPTCSVSAIYRTALSQFPFYLRCSGAPPAIRMRRKKQSVPPGLRTNVTRLRSRSNHTVEDLFAALNLTTAQHAGIRWQPHFEDDFVILLLSPFSYSYARALSKAGFVPFPDDSLTVPVGRSYLWRPIETLRDLKHWVFRL